ncbi:MAG: polyprenyl synthetase family protein [Hyphomicrobiales bacterium]|uniref:polyprenyl synthetase family protein n=1 Tax=Nisaea sp. TaxID=2024842 RepID=UPI0032682AA9
MTPDNLLKHIADHGQQINALLEREISNQENNGAPRHLVDAMAYATLNGGKRLRPFLLVEAASLFGRRDDGTLLAGAALECVHSYSLVHDDLPALDNDDLRRGQPTTHRQFDEETAILVGDTLQTLAFELLSRDEIHLKPEVRLKIVSGLAIAAGAAGMVGGQMLDLAAEGRHGAKAPRQSEGTIKDMQSMKTGALLRFACTAGATLGSASKANVEALSRFGDVIGLAFQLADDILDRTGNAATLGKQAGKDAAAGKATLVDFMGLEKAKEHLAAQVAEAHKILEPFGKDADTLKATASFIASRQS